MPVPHRSTGAPDALVDFHTAFHGVGDALYGASSVGTRPGPVLFVQRALRRVQMRTEIYVPDVRRHRLIFPRIISSVAVEDGLGE